MKRISFVLMLLSGIFYMSACSNGDDEPAVAPPSIVGTWLQTDGVYSPPYYGETDYFPSGVVCWDDDLVVFKADGTFEINEGATKCDADDPQVYGVGTYTVNGNQITISELGEESVATFSVTATTLQVSFIFEEDGTTYTDLQTYTRL